MKTEHRRLFNTTTMAMLRFCRVFLVFFSFLDRIETIEIGRFGHWLPL